MLHHTYEVKVVAGNVGGNSAVSGPLSIGRYVTMCICYVNLCRLFVKTALGLHVRTLYTLTLPAQNMPNVKCVTNS